MIFQSYSISSTKNDKKNIPDSIAPHCGIDSGGSVKLSITDLTLLTSRSPSSVFSSTLKINK